MKLFIATTNHGKLSDFKKCFKDDDFEIESIIDRPEIGDIEETGKSYFENAELKARSCFRQTGMPTLADDSGLEVDYLNGFPGLHSKRWAGEEDATDYDRAIGIIKKLEGVPKNKRSARLKAFVVFWDGIELHVADNAIEGYIPEDLDVSKIQLGFPYRAILMIPQYNKLYHDLTEEENALISHRLKSINELRPTILASLRD